VIPIGQIARIRRRLGLTVGQGRRVFHVKATKPLVTIAVDAGAESVENPIASPLCKSGDLSSADPSIRQPPRKDPVP
jgi:hypothetical protein